MTHDPAVVFRHQRKAVSALQTRAKVVNQRGYDRAMFAEGRAMDLGDGLRVVGSFLPDLHTDAPYRCRTSRFRFGLHRAGPAPRRVPVLTAGLLAALEVAASARAPETSSAS